MGQELLALRGRQANLDTIVLIDGPEVLDRSDAVFRIAGRLAGWPKLLRIFAIVPRPLRDFGYDLFAKRRYRWFGKTDRCLLPTDEQRSRFLVSS